MCGIVGYAGSRQAAPVLLDGLEKLEYRGYDSAGVCVHNDGTLNTVKAKGRLSVLRDRLEGGDALPGTVGIGHTRWATHGAPSDLNSHPHLSWTGKIAVVHNGIIENEARLREKCLRKGATFQSETDTEVVSNLIGYYYEKFGDFVQAVREAVMRLEGSFALGILCIDCPDTMIAVKKDSPLIFGFGEGENFVASDVPAILKYTQTVAYLEDGDMAVFDADGVVFMDSAGEVVERKREKITWEISAAERAGYDHFMIKEINEQVQTVIVEYDENRRVTYGFSQMEEVELAYAITIHKSQGSEYPAVVIPLLSGPRMLMSRNLLYTAVTRARQCVCIVGLQEMFDAMVDNQVEQRRYSSLDRRIRELQAFV